MVRTPAVPAANAKNSAAVRMTFFNMASLPIQVDHAVFYTVSAIRCDGYHFCKTRCDFSHTSGKPIGALASTAVAILTLQPAGFRRSRPLPVSRRSDLRVALREDRS